MADDLPGLRVAAVLAEVAQQPGAEVLGLADVDEPAALVEHAVDAGQLRRVLFTPRLERADALPLEPRTPAVFSRRVGTGSGPKPVEPVVAANSAAVLLPVRGCAAHAGDRLWKVVYAGILLLDTPREHRDFVDRRMPR